MSRFAENTTVEPENSRQELIRTLERYGASHFVEARAPKDMRYAIEFQLRGRWYRFKIEAKPTAAFIRESERRSWAWPSPEELQKSPQYYKRELALLEKRRLQEWRRQWRVLINHTKMLMDMALDDEEESGVAGGRTEDILLPYLLLPDHETFAERYAPQVDRMYATGEHPDSLVKMLPPPGETR